MIRPNSASVSVSDNTQHRKKLRLGLISLATECSRRVSAPVQLLLGFWGLNGEKSGLIKMYCNLHGAPRTAVRPPGPPPPHPHSHSLFLTLSA